MTFPHFILVFEETLVELYRQYKRILSSYASRYLHVLEQLAYSQRWSDSPIDVQQLAVNLSSNISMSNIAQRQIGSLSQIQPPPSAACPLYRQFDSRIRPNPCQSDFKLPGCP